MSTPILPAIFLLALPLSWGPVLPGGPRKTVRQAPALVIEDLPWTGLELRAKKLFFSASVRITVERLSSGEALEEMVAWGGDLEGLLPSGDTVDRIHTASTMTTGKTEVAEAWIDSVTGAVLQTVKEVRGRGNYWKLRRFFAGGYHQVREAPMSRKERKAGRKRWTKHEELLVRWDSQPPEGRIVTSSYALVYLLSRSRFDRGGAPQFWLVPFKEDLVEVRLTPGPPRRTKLRIDQRWPGGSEDLALTADALTIHVVPRWLDGHTEEAAGNGFMGMRGPAEITLLPGGSVPVRIDGSVKHAGHVISRLEKLHLP